MVTAAQNERLTRVGPGTPLGELMRRYWQPITAASRLAEMGVMPITLLGEELNLFRDGEGRLGLVAKRCAHRCYDLRYGIPEERGLRCAYHGWLYDVSGQCIEQPAEPKGSKLKDRIKLKSYPVREVEGLIFAYLGPTPAPEVPIWDWMTRERTMRLIGVHDVAANWLQNMENAPDLDHTHWLHGAYYGYLLDRQGVNDPENTLRKLSDGFKTPYEKTRYDRGGMGMISRAIFQGDDESHPLWAIGQQILFPNISCVSTRHSGMLYMFMQFRVPTDDYNTRVITYHVFEPDPRIDVPNQETIPCFDVPMRQIDGEVTIEAIQSQDTLCMEAQGAIMDRTEENLGHSDRGIVLLRNLLLEQMTYVERGEDPINTFRDPASAHVHVPNCDVGGGQTAFGAAADAPYVRGMSTVGMIFGPMVEQIEDLAEESARKWQADQPKRRVDATA